MNDLSAFHPADRVDNMAAKVARELIEKHLEAEHFGVKVVILRRVATERFDWASPFFWTVLDTAGRYHTLAMKYDTTTNRWYIESGVDQEWSFEPEDIPHPEQRGTIHLLKEGE